MFIPVQSTQLNKETGYVYIGDIISRGISIILKMITHESAVVDQNISTYGSSSHECTVEHIFDKFHSNQICCMCPLLISTYAHAVTIHT